MTLPLCFQNILGQTEEGSSRQENAQKALSAVSKVRRVDTGEGRGARGRGKWRGQVAAGMDDSASPHQIIERCSAEVGRMKQTEELIRLTQRLRFHKVKVSGAQTLHRAFPHHAARLNPPLFPLRLCPWSPGHGAWNCRGS